MSNEVLKDCPKCNRASGRACIREITSDLSSLDLDRPSSINFLSKAELLELQDAISDAIFYCSNESCGISFRLYHLSDERSQIIRDICSRKAIEL